jgi:hypothetical protein
MTLPRSRPREVQHPRARVHTVDVDLRVNVEQFAKKMPVAFAKDQRPLRTRDLVDPKSAGVLEGFAERDGFKQSVRAGDAIETHKSFSASTKTSGVSRTRSARAVRSSHRDPEDAREEPLPTDGDDRCVEPEDVKPNHRPP